MVSPLNSGEEDLLTAYAADVASGHIKEDEGQQQVLRALNALRLRLHAVGETETRLPFWRRWLLGHQAGAEWHYSKEDGQPLQGLYIWGGVGRGKTYLMDLFYERLTLKRKKRYHFHRFMREVHESLKACQGHANPLVKVAQDIAKQARVLCFDECFVSDITDAMILSGLFHALFELGVCLVTTSNLPPDDLYKDGLQRARFLPAIHLLNTYTQVIELDGAVDHRVAKLQQAELYHWPVDEAGEQAMRHAFQELAPDGIQYDAMLPLLGREIPVKAWSDDVAWFEFAAVCEGPRSVHDYIELAISFHAVFVSGVPVFNATSDAAARRFIHLVDEFYDRRVKLIVLAEAAIQELYDGQTLRFEFERTQSRLVEMQSLEYLESAHRC